MAQREFDWDEPRATTATKEPETIEQRFERFHKANPGFFEEFCRLARQLRDRGYRRYSAKGIFEVIRFRTALDGRPGECWKLNNNYSSRYTRLLLEADPTFEGFFETRELKAK